MKNGNIDFLVGIGENRMTIQDSKNIQEGFKVVGDFMAVQNAINECIGKNKKAIENINRQTFLLGCVIATVSFIVYNQQKKVDILSKDLAEMKGETNEQRPID